MKYIPIIFSGSMIRETRSGRKTVTRRICSKALDERVGEWADAVHPARDRGWISWWGPNDEGRAELTREAYPEGWPCPYGAPGDRLWFRETYAEDVDVPHYRADGVELGPDVRWRPAIYMPKSACRIVADVLDVRVERLKDIVWHDIRKEGIRCPEHDFESGFCCSECPALRQAWADGWDALNGKRDGGVYAWEKNPWVFRVAYRPLGGDELAAALRELRGGT